jgi:hypothetical protein
MINWKLEKKKIDELVQYDKNPRCLSEKEHRSLSDSLDKFGCIEKPVVNLDNTIIGGHQRLEVLKLKGAVEIDCWVPDRQLDEKEVEEANIRLNRNNGDWDYDILGNSFDIGDLLSWGFDEDDLGLGKKEKPKKEPKPVISLEFCDKDSMLEHLQKCEEIAQSSSAKMKVRG